MPKDLYGDEYLTNWDYARKIVTKGAKLPFYNFYINSNGRSVYLYCIDENGQQVKQSMFDRGGLYAIYQKNKTDIECLYVGFTSRSAYYRIYRFAKELLGLSRDDEDHVAARLARQDGINPDSLLVKFLPAEELPNVDYRSNITNIDETVAILLNAKYNTRTSQ